MHDSDDIDAQTGKPEMILYYNSTKGGVDMVDQLCSNYNVARATRRWPMVIFYSLVNISGINTQVIYNANNQEEKMLRRHFLEQLAYSLIEPQLKSRVFDIHIPRNIKVRIREICNIHQEEENQPVTRVGRCALCSSKKNRKTKYQCKFCKIFLCLEHITSVCNDCYASHV